MGQDFSIDDIEDVDLELVKQYEDHVIDIIPDEENPKWKVNIVVEQEYMRPYIRLRTRKGEPLVKVREPSSLIDLSDFTELFMTGDCESFPKPSSNDELRAFDDQIFVTGTKSVQVKLKKVSRTRSIPDLSTLRKKSKAPCRPKFFDKLLNNVKLSRKTKSSASLSGQCPEAGSFDEEEEANEFVPSREDYDKSIQEIKSLSIDRFQLNELEQEIKNIQKQEESLAEKRNSEASGEQKEEKQNSAASEEQLEESAVFKGDRKSLENSEVRTLKRKSNESVRSDKEDVITLSTDIEPVGDDVTKNLKTDEEDNSDLDDNLKDNNVESDLNKKEVPIIPQIAIVQRQDSTESTSSTDTADRLRKASVGIVQERLAAFRRINERGNRNPKLRRSMSVPNSPELLKRNYMGDENSELYKKVQKRFQPDTNMSEDANSQFGGMSVKPGYVKALVNQINKNKGANTEELSHKNESNLENGNKICDVNGDSHSIQSDDVPHSSSFNESAYSSNRNSIKSSECGHSSDATSCGHDKTENESGIVCDGRSSLNPEELFDSSWSDSDLESDPESGEESYTVTEENNRAKLEQQVSESSEPPKDRIQKIVEELLSTEKTYVQRLKLLDQTFKFQVVQENKIHNFIPDGVIPQMFSNVQSIYQFHSNFLLPQIEERVQSWTPESRIGDIMKQYAPLLKMYTEYVKNFDNAMNLITVWSEKAPKFAAIIKEIQLTPECGSLTLQHHMLEPVQRIPRYEMLLKDYLKRLPEDAPDREDAQVALEMVTTAATHSNEAMKKIDSFNKLLEIVRKIDTSENFISPTRELVREGRITKISARGGERQERFLFLFNDLMLICFEQLLGSYKIKSQLDMDGMEIMERSDKCLRWILEGEQIDIPNTFYVKSRQKIIQFLDENSNGEPSGWCETIKKTIASYKRRQSRKSEEVKRSSASQGADVNLGAVAPKWIKDDDVSMCMRCAVRFTAIRRRHHCRACGDVVCGKCSSKKVPLSYDNNHYNRVCDNCYHLLKNDEEEPTTPTHDKNSQKKKKDILKVNASDPSVLAGYLHISTDKGKCWHRRWVAIHSDFVLYTFKAHQDPCALSSLPLPGHTVEEVEKSEHGEREHVFTVSHKKSNMYLSSETTHSKERWVSVLKKVVVAELPDDIEADETSKRDSSHSSSSNEFTESSENKENSQL